MIVLYTDFGNVDPYIGQVRNVLAQQSASVTVIDLLNNAPKFDPVASAYLLASYVNEFSRDTVFLGIVDPGVGSISRRALALSIDGRWFVGPDNGLFNMVLLQAENKSSIHCFEILWRPDAMSNTFHGRDVFAPIAARLALGDTLPGKKIPADSIIDTKWPCDRYSIIYIDHFGNAMTGIQAAKISNSAILTINHQAVHFARTYSEVPVASAFWYCNANGLVEVAMNQANASRQLSIEIGSEVTLET